jgi:hypothetical protein
MLRTTAPQHRFDAAGKEHIRAIIASVRKELAVIEEELTR